MPLWLANRRRTETAANADGTITVTGANGSDAFAAPTAAWSASTAGAPNGTTVPAGAGDRCLAPSTITRTLPRGCDTDRVRLACVLVAAVLVALFGGGCSSGGGSTKAFCDSVRAGENPLDVFDRYDPTNVATARDQLQRGVDRMKELERAAPSEIRDDLVVLVDVGSKLVVALDPSAGATPAPDFRGDFERVQNASTAVTRFTTDRCGVDLDSTAPPAGGPGG
jgi:hypothetical protein